MEKLHDKARVLTAFIMGAISFIAGIVFLVQEKSAWVEGIVIVVGAVAIIFVWLCICFFFWFWIIAWEY